METMPNGWIWTSRSDPEAVRERPVLCRFCKEVNLPAAPARALCRVTADSRYILYVNGTAVCRGPQKGDGQVWFFDEIDLAPWLRPGPNVLAAVVLHYPQTVEGGNRSVWRMEHPAFAAAGRFEWEGGSLEWKTDDSWLAAPVENLRIHGEYPDTSRLVIQEEAHGDAALQGWQAPGWDAAGWQPAMVYPRGAFLPTVSPGFQRKRSIPFLFEKELPLAVFHAAAGDAAGWEKLLAEGQPLTLPAGSETVVDLTPGRLLTAYLTIGLQGGGGSVIQLLSAEGYVQPGSPIKGDRLDWVHGDLTGPVDRYTAGGFGTEGSPEQYEPFWFRAFRFLRVKVQIGSEPLTVLSLACRETGYPLEVKTRVRTGDESLAAIWQISENALRACMHETYEDCPFYEQLQYLMDTRSEILYTYACAADDRLARQAIDSFARSQRADGLLNACYPAYKPNVIPGFSIYYILMLHDHMMYFGDRALVERYFPVVERILRFFEDLRDAAGPAGGLIGPLPGAGGFGSGYWCFVDWAKGWQVGVPPAAACGPTAIDNLMYCLGLSAAAELAAFIGREDQAAALRARAETLRQTLRTCCAGKDGMLRDGPGLDQYSQHVQVFAVLTDTLTGEAARAALEHTLEDETIPQCTVAMGYYLFRALEQCGLYRHTNRLWDKWRRMLQNHLTTCVESDGSYTRSDCHGWGALALYELPSAILGVRPAAPGYAAVRFAPAEGVLDHAEGEVITPRGTIRAGWRRSPAGELTKQIDLPEGMTLAP